MLLALMAEEVLWANYLLLALSPTSPLSALLLLTGLEACNLHFSDDSVSWG